MSIDATNIQYGIDQLKAQFPEGYGSQIPASNTPTYQAPVASPIPAPQPTQQTQTPSGFSMDNYRGWDYNSALADYNATGGPQQQSAGGIDQYQGIRDEISGGWDSYIGNLDTVLNIDLPAQRQAQENIARNSYNQGLGNLGTQRTLGLKDLTREGENITIGKNRSIVDLEENMRNLFQSGNNRLGVMGASDSSASRQYAYALSKLGTKARTSIQNQARQSQDLVGDRQFKLNTLYQQGIEDFDVDYGNKVQAISSWFSEQQSALRMQQGSAQQNKSADLASLSKDILNTAMSAMQQVKTEDSNRRSALESWAMSNAKTIGQLQTNMQGISNISTPKIGYQPLNDGINVNPSNASTYTNYGSGTGINNNDDDKDIFGNSSNPFNQYQSGWSI